MVFAGITFMVGGFRVAEPGSGRINTRGANRRGLLSPPVFKASIRLETFPQTSASIYETAASLIQTDPPCTRAAPESGKVCAAGAGCQRRVCRGGFVRPVAFGRRLFAVDTSAFRAYRAVRPVARSASPLHDSREQRKSIRCPQTAPTVTGAE